jgi:hypothetical protein
MRAAVAAGARVALLTVESLGDVDWPRDVLADVHLMPSLDDRDHVVRGVSWLARRERIDRVVALDEFDLEVAATLREHLRVPGMGETTTRRFRDKLAMRMAAAGAGIRVPSFTGVIHHDGVRRFMEQVEPPWVLKPRLSASTTGIRTVGSPEALWAALEELGDEQSFCVLERFVRGDVYHVDGVVADGVVRFAEVHRYAHPPLQVYHGGGLFCSRTVERADPRADTLRELNSEVVAALGLRRGAFHTEFIWGSDDQPYFLEIGARVGGAHIADMAEAATGLNVWREWARAEVAGVRGEAYGVAPHREEYGGVLITLARQEWPDTSAYDAPEVVGRPRKHHHAGLVLRSADTARLDRLLDQYMRRFYEDFHAALPAADRPTA